MRTSENSAGLSCTSITPIGALGDSPAEFMEYRPFVLEQ